MEWFLKVVKEHYADFEGRARRKEYWMFALVHFCISVAILILGVILALISAKLAILAYILLMIVGLGLIIPGIAVAVRRLHDTGKSGWMYLVVFIPLIGFIWLIIMLVTDGVIGDNQYGPDPKAGER